MAALPQSALISVEEYLNTEYHPDVEFVDGLLVQRSAGDWLHSLVQSNILFAIRLKYPHLKVVLGLRTSVTSTRFRLPDVCVLQTAPKTRYLLEPPLLVVEVLSEGDAVSAVLEKLKEYAAKGVKNIWLVDPRLRLLFRYCESRLEEIESEEISTLDGAISISRGEIFAD